MSWQANDQKGPEDQHPVPERPGAVFLTARARSWDVDGKPVPIERGPSS
jgi:hypothetical protein